MDLTSIARLDRNQIDLVHEHLRRHIAESGRHGVHWLPYDPEKLISLPSVSTDDLDLSYEDVGWQRWHVVLDTSGKVVGHLQLKGARFDRALHRSELGIGLEHAYRSRGLGSELLAIAINQSRSIPTIDWLDLHVLSCNRPAIRLYLKHGFQEISRTTDFCKIDGVPADDIFMSLWVGQ